MTGLAKDNKRYFWLKLKADFFDQKEVKMLRRIAGGDTYTIIYLKMLLLSLKNDGRIYFDGIAENFVEEIALDIDEDSENTQITFNYLQQKGLIEFESDVEIDMTNIASMIGSETESARRVRKHRDSKALQSNNRVTDRKHLGNTELEIEKEIELEREKKPKYPAAAQSYYENNIGMIKPVMLEDLQYYAEKFDDADEIIKEAIDIAISRSAKNWGYVKGIVRKWQSEGLKKIEQVKEFENSKSAQSNETTIDYLKDL